ncbi:MAG: hypothetical protein ACKVQK_20595 [Burkholderiales bacterium]
MNENRAAQVPRGANGCRWSSEACAGARQKAKARRILESHSLAERGYLNSRTPRFQVFDAPGLFDSVEHAQRVFADPEVRKRLASFGASKGVEPLVTFVNGPLGLLSHKAIRQVSDFNGQKIRAPGGAPIQPG